MRSVRILVWHGWLLEGSGSNVATARIVEVWRSAGSPVPAVCQGRPPKWCTCGAALARDPGVDAPGSVARGGPSNLEPNTDASKASGRCVLLRPDIGTMLPVF